jgi:predicted Zn-ribbon and HTH transcriptional regulator
MGKKGKRKKKNKRRKNKMYDSYSGWGSGGYSYRSCDRKEIRYVMTLGENCHVWAGSGSDVEDALEMRGQEGWPDIKLVINCGGKSCASYSEVKPAATFTGGAKEILPTLEEGVNKTSEPPAVLHLAWPDMGTPPLTETGIKMLFEDLSKFDGNIAVHCLGGHGRTGTLLAALAHLGGIVEEGEDVIQWVRDNYCHKAVESGSQIKWLKETMGIETKVDGTKETTTYKKKSTTLVPSADGNDKVDHGYAEKQLSGWVKSYVAEESDEVIAEFKHLVNTKPKSMHLAEIAKLAKANVEKSAELGYKACADCGLMSEDVMVEAGMSKALCDNCAAEVHNGDRKVEPPTCEVCGKKDYEVMDDNLHAAMLCAACEADPGTAHALANKKAVEDGITYA